MSGWEALEEAQRAHMAAGLPSRTGPLVQASQRRGLDDLRRRFERGDQWALILAINACARHELPMPEWAAMEWLRRSLRALGYRVASWDDVMPRIKPKGRKRSALETAWRWTIPVVLAVHEKSAAEPAHPLARLLRFVKDRSNTTRVR